MGDTPVVDVADFNDMTGFDAAGNYHSDAMHVVERFKRTGADTISYEATNEDPKVLTKPFRISLRQSRVTARNAQLLEYECYAIKEGPQLRWSTNQTRIAPGRRVNSGVLVPKNLLSAIGLSSVLTCMALGPAPALSQDPQVGVNPLLTPNPYNSPSEVKGGPVPRLPDGKPDMQGVCLVCAPGNSMSMLPVETLPGGRGPQRRYHRSP